MIQPPPAAPVAPPPAASRVRTRLRNAILAAVGGAVVGFWLARNLTPSLASTASLRSPMALSLLFWVLLTIYWEIAARNSAATRASESGASRALHLTLINGAMIVAFWPFPGWLNGHGWSFPRILPESPLWAPLGIASGAAGMVLAIWARRVLGRNWSGAVTLKVAHELIRSGPYRRIRHPIYTGAFLMYFGTALISGRLQGPIALVMVAIAYARKIRQEETILRGEFGARYEEYTRESWALVPGVF
jgi:protein-S-isoprenylcysteine O-methyltransferase Ste14